MAKLSPIYIVVTGISIYRYFQGFFPVGCQVRKTIFKIRIMGSVKYKKRFIMIMELTINITG